MGTLTAAILERYTDEQKAAVKRGLALAASTRVSGKIAASVKLGILVYLDKFDPDIVVKSIETYAKCISPSKTERYWYGILRGLQKERQAGNEVGPKQFPPEYDPRADPGNYHNGDMSGPFLGDPRKRVAR